MRIFAITFAASPWYSHRCSNRIRKAIQFSFAAPLTCIAVIGLLAVISILSGGVSNVQGATLNSDSHAMPDSTGAMAAVVKEVGADQNSAQSISRGLAPSQQISITVGTLVPIDSDARPTPTPGPLFEPALPEPTRPSSEVVDFSNGYEWVAYSSDGVRFNYPNGWKPSVESSREDGMEVGSIGVVHEERRLDITWYLLEDDLLWMFQNRGRYRDLTNETIQFLEESYIDLYPRSWIAENTNVDRLYIGGWPTFSTYAHNLVIDGNWTDADKISRIGGVVICGPKRICLVEYGKVDRPYSSGDWTLLDTFMQSLSFVRDDPLPYYVLTRVPRPTASSTSMPKWTSTPTVTPMPTLTPTPTTIATVASEGDETTQSSGWLPYHSEIVAFEAMIPPDFEVEEEPDEDGNAGGTVFIQSRYEPDAPFILIGVYAVSYVEKGEEVPDRTWIAANSEEFLVDKGATILRGPEFIEVAGLPAVYFVHQLPLEESDLLMQSYRTTLSYGGWLYTIEVMGPTTDAETVTEYYKKFIASFAPKAEVHDEIEGVAGNTTTPTPSPSTSPVPLTFPGDEPWISYSSDMAGFESRIPADVEIEEWPPDEAMGMRGIAFNTPADSSSASPIFFFVFAMPIAGDTNNVPQTFDEMSQSASQFVEDDNGKIVYGPVRKEVAGQAVAYLVHDRLSEDGRYTLRTYEVLTSNGIWMHDIEVSGLAEDRRTTKAYFDTFVASFVPMNTVPPVMMEVSPTATPARDGWRPPRR